MTTAVGFVPSIGPFELILLLVIVLVIFGVGRLPEIGGALGKGIREFREASREDNPPPPPAEAEKKEEQKGS